MPRVNLNYLLIFIPIAVGLSWFGASPLVGICHGRAHDHTAFEDRR